MAKRKILFVNESTKKDSRPHSNPEPDWDLATGLDLEGLPPQKQSGATDNDSSADTSKDITFDFDAFEDLLAEEELQSAMQQHYQAKQAQSQQEQKEQKEQTDIEELRSFTASESEDDEARERVDNKESEKAVAAGERTIVSNELAPVLPKELAPKDLPDNECKGEIDGNDVSSNEPQPAEEASGLYQIPKLEGYTSNNEPQSAEEELNASSDDANPDADKVSLESFASEETREERIDEDKVEEKKVEEEKVDVESLSARHLAMNIHSDSIYSLHAAKSLAQHRHLRAAICKIRIKRYRDSLDFDRLAQIVDSQASLTKEDRLHLQLFELSLQKFLTDLFDFIYVIGSVGNELSQLIAAEHEDFFETMTGLTRHEFTQLCDIGVFDGNNLMELLKTFNSWCSQTMSAERFVLHHTKALQEAG